MNSILLQLMGAYNGGQEIFIDLDGHLTRARLKGRKLSQVSNNTRSHGYCMSSALFINRIESILHGTCKSFEVTPSCYEH